jgi:high-affinity iron transporter
MPIYYAFKTTTVLLILFAAGLLARGVHEFAEAGMIPEIGKLSIALLPQKGTFMADMIKAIFGITQSMDMIQITFYALYVGIMSWYVFFRNKQESTESA